MPNTFQLDGYRLFFFPNEGNPRSAGNLSLDESMMRVDLSDGRKRGVPLACFPRLLRATPEQRLRYEMSGNGAGPRGEALGEEFSVEGLLMEIGDQTQGHSLAARD